MSDYTVSVTGSPLTEIGVFVCRELILVHTGRLPLTMVVNNTFIWRRHNCSGMVLLSLNEKRKQRATRLSICPKLDSQERAVRSISCSGHRTTIGYGPDDVTELFFFQEVANLEFEQYHLRWLVQVHDAEAVMPNSRTNKVDKTVWCSGLKQGRQVSTSVWWCTVEPWSCPAADGRHQQEVHSTGRLNMERRYDCMCWFYTGSAYMSGFGSSGENGSWLKVNWGGNGNQVIPDAI